MARHRNQVNQLMIAAVAAFSTYFCMYAFRKPFTAATFDDQQWLGTELKIVLVISQLLGYMLSKFIGIKVISEMEPEHRAVSIIGLIVTAEIALVGFAFLPLPLKVVMMFLNGLPLGMVFGLVLAYLEGRKETEALSAALCASFIISSGVVKSTGRWLVQDMGVSEFQMPMLTGAIFFPALLFSIWMLQKTPLPDDHDQDQRGERMTMDRASRQRFWSAYWPGLSLLVLVYVALTVVRTIRDDFGVEIWRDMGIDGTPSVFATSESLVALVVTALIALTVWIKNNRQAIWTTFALMCLAFTLVGGSVFLQTRGLASPLGFMVACGVGLYIPYVAFHTTVFERLIAASRRPCNLGFLMYVADAIGYLGYAVVIVAKTQAGDNTAVLPYFRGSLCIVTAGSIVALMAVSAYFRRVLLDPVAEFDTMESDAGIAEDAAPITEPA